MEITQENLTRLYRMKYCNRHNFLTSLSDKLSENTSMLTESRDPFFYLTLYHRTGTVGRSGVFYYVKVVSFSVEESMVLSCNHLPSYVPPLPIFL